MRLFSENQHGRDEMAACATNEDIHGTNCAVCRYLVGYMTRLLAQAVDDIGLGQRKRSIFISPWMAVMFPSFHQRDF